MGFLLVVSRWDSLIDTETEKAGSRRGKGDVTVAGLMAEYDYEITMSNVQS